MEELKAMVEGEKPVEGLETEKEKIEEQKLKKQIREIKEKEA